MVDNIAAPAQQSLWRRLEARLLPHVCRLCGAGSELLMDLCPGCLQDLPHNRRPCPHCANPLPPGTPAHSPCADCARNGRPAWIDRILCPLVYDFPVDRLLLGLKFHQDLAAGRLLGELMAASPQLSERPVEAIVPVPLDWRRRIWRGFNQAQELARPLRRASGIPIRPGLLRRRGGAEPQARLPLKKRRGNIRGRFHCPRRPPARVAILDDVVTSASTVSEAARALRIAGAEYIEVWACARTP